MPIRDILNAASGAASYGPSDSYFYDVSLLLNGDGTNGAQNNTFLDSSSNNFTITRNGSATQGSFSPYGTLWSNYLPTDRSSQFNVNPSVISGVGSSNFSVELWVNIPSASPGGYDQGLFSYGPAGVYATGTSYLDFQIRNSDGLLCASIAQATSPDLVSSIPVPTNQWVHLALCRSGTTISSYINGTRVATTTSSVSIGSAGDTCAFGGQWYASESIRRLAGYLSNLRVVNGSSAYDATQTTIAVPTAPLTAITNTTLLVGGSNRFIDKSSNNYSITVTGSPLVQRFSPFNPTAPYSTTIIGGSMYANDNGYLSSTGTLGLGSGDFTVEGWIYPTTYTYSNMIACIGDDQTSTGVSFYTYQNSMRMYNSTGSFVKTVSLNLNSWNHVAWVRQSGIVTFYFNGISVGTSNFSSNISSSGFKIGADLNSGTLYNGLQGYMSDNRIVNSAIYTTAFTPPTAPLSAVSGTQLLCNMINAGIPDLAMQNDLQTVGNAQVSTAVKKYGTGSLYFNAAPSYLLSNAPSSNLYAFGTGDFTVEFWLYLNSTSGVIVLFDTRNSSESNCPVLYMSSGTLLFYVGGVDRASGGSLSANTWYHVALCRSGTSTRLFVNGVQPNATYSDTNNYICQTNRPAIGANGYVGGGGVGLYPLNGYIDDLRITNGYARYTTTFTPPTAALPTF